MTWNQDRLAPVDTLLFHSELVKLGHFQCGVTNPHFPVTHSLDNDVLVFVRNPLWYRRGTGRFRFIEPGAILLHRAGAIVERKKANDLGDNAYWFGIRPDIFVELLQRYGLSETDMGEALVATPSLRYRVATLLSDVEAGIADPLYVEEESLRFLESVCESRAASERRISRQQPHRSNRHRRLVDRARAHIDRHLCEPLALADIASATGSSRFHLCRVFKRQTGLTLSDYRTRQRLGRVVDRIVSGPGVDSPRVDLTKLAIESGFASHSHLSRVFSQQLGYPPSQVDRLRVSSPPAF